MNEMIIGKSAVLVTAFCFAEVILSTTSRVEFLAPQQKQYESCSLLFGRANPQSDDRLWASREHVLRTCPQFSNLVKVCATDIASINHSLQVRPSDVPLSTLVRIAENFALSLSLADLAGVINALAYHGSEPSFGEGAIPQLTVGSYLTMQQSPDRASRLIRDGVSMIVSILRDVRSLAVEECLASNRSTRIPNPIYRSGKSQSISGEIWDFYVEYSAYYASLN